MDINTTEESHDHMDMDTTEESHDHMDMDTTEDTSMTCMSAGTNMECWHMGDHGLCCEWHEDMGHCMSATESDTAEFNMCTQATSQMECEHFQHAYFCQGVDYDCVWDSTASTCERENSCNDQTSQMACEHYAHTNSITDYNCVWSSNSCSVSWVTSEADAVDHSSHSSSHEMAMYFHTGTGDILWFEGLETDTNGKYFAGCALIFVFAIIREMALNQRKQVKTAVKESKEGMTLLMMFYDTSMVGLSIFSSYMLMLAFMTYNVGFCIVTVTAFMTSNFFAHLLKADPQIQEDCCAPDVELGPTDSSEMNPEAQKTTE